MKQKKMIYTIFGYTQKDEVKLAEILSEKLEIELVKDEDFYEDEGPYVFFGKEKSLVDYLCIKKQFRVGDSWDNDYHKICPWAVEINFTSLSSFENTSRAEKVRELLKDVSEIKEIDFSEWNTDV
ncbi:hypothetical protein [Tenacibaculum sp.]|uniref:hypothetical protein n=1 Tax=Tenacibaculum sp. TaxID=1906242 RepID=UPI003D101EE8